MHRQSNKKESQFFKFLDFADLQISRFEGFILAMGVILMALNTIAGVISRFVFNDSIIYTDDLNRFFIIMVTFTGISYAARYARHIRMSAIYDALPRKLRKIFTIVISFTTSSFMFFLCYFSTIYILDIHSSGRIIPTLEVPVYFTYLWVPVGFFITGMQYLFTVFKNFKSEKVYLSTNVEDEYCLIDMDKDI
jgi:TRAP-type C4-dicarboxylate transport system permease small subunit